MGKRMPKKSRKGDQFTKRQREVESEDMKKVPNNVRRDASNMHACKPNDWRWYAQNEQLMRDYASYSFNNPVGEIMLTGNPRIDSASVPGVMALRFYPCIGFANDETSPINVAMRRLYSFVRHANSGASNYDAPDLMMYCVAVDSAYMFLAHMKRVYGVMLNYTPFNRYYPKALVAAMQFNFDNIEKNLNDFRGYINQYAIKQIGRAHV